jgi:hypothetical protein
VREESHIDEMRTAIRGDFERLAERRGEQELLRVEDEHEAEQDADPDVSQAPETDPVPELEPAASTEPASDEAPRRSWLARIFSPP